MTDILQEHTALITGASGGLGLHFAETLARAGARVVLAARRVEALEAAVQALNDAGHRAHAVTMDVTDETSVQTALADALRWAGDDSLSILVNNAGISREGMAALDANDVRERDRGLSSGMGDTKEAVE